jgi:hypothetical protein
MLIQGVINMLEQPKRSDRNFFIGLGLTVFGGLILFLSPSSPSLWGLEWLLYPPVLAVEVGIVMMLYYNFQQLRRWVKKEAKPESKQIGFLIINVSLVILACPVLVFMVLWPGF